MKISYTFSPEVLREGANEFLWHRRRIVTLLFPVLGVIFLLFGINYLFGMGDTSYISGGIMCSAGAFYLIRFKLRTASMIKNAFQSNPNERMVTLTTTDETVSITDGENAGTGVWTSFVDFKVCKSGLLIYPQKQIFYWIPQTAEIEGGTWQDFTALVSSKITKKV